MPVVSDDREQRVLSVLEALKLEEAGIIYKCDVGSEDYHPRAPWWIVGMAVTMLQSGKGVVGGESDCDLPNL